MARDSSRDETQKLHKKWLKHQAFMAELAQNKEWLDKIEKVSAAGRPSDVALLPRRHISFYSVDLLFWFFAHSIFFFKSATLKFTANIMVLSLTLTDVKIDNDKRYRFGVFHVNFDLLM